MPYFSASTGGFYTSDIHGLMGNPGSTVPSDAVEVTDQQYSDLLAAQAAGQQIVAGPAGAPVAQPRPGPTAAQLWAAYQAEAKAALAASDVTLLRCFEHGVTPSADWTAYRAALRAILGAGAGDPTQPLPARPAYPVGT